jgi:hypothetical protein
LNLTSGEVDTLSRLTEDAATQRVSFYGSAGRKKGMASELEMVWVETDGELAVWEIEHLFGNDLCFGRTDGRHYWPMRWGSLNRPTSSVERRRALNALFCWAAGDVAVVQSLLSDLASGD